MKLSHEYIRCRFLASKRPMTDLQGNNCLQVNQIKHWRKSNDDAWNNKFWFSVQNSSLTEEADIRVLRRQFGFTCFIALPFGDLEVTDMWLNCTVLLFNHLFRPSTNTQATE